MKKFLLSLFLIIGVVLSAYCQESKNEQSVYCEVIGEGNFSGKKVKVEIFFGEVIHDKIRQQAEKVKSKKFTSMLDALNYMAKKVEIRTNLRHNRNVRSEQRLFFSLCIKF